MLLLHDNMKSSLSTFMTVGVIVVPDADLLQIQHLYNPPSNNSHTEKNKEPYSYGGRDQ